MLREFFSKKMVVSCSGVVCWVALASVWVAGQQPADLVLYNGKVLTVDSSFSVAQAIAIRGDEVAGVGTDQQMLAMAGPNTKKIDLKGRSVIPGINDTHNHIHDYAESAYGGEIGPEGLLAYAIDWKGVRTPEDVVNQVRGMIAKYKPKPGEWMYFASLNDDLSDQNMVAVMIDGLNRWELDKAAPNNPIVMALAWPNVNGIVTNSAAIDEILPKHGDFIKKYGRMWIDSSGRPEGHFESPANRFFLSSLPTPAASSVAPIYKKYMEELAAEGVTTLVTRLPEYAIDAFKLLESRGEMLLRLPYGKESLFGTTQNLDTNMKAVGKLMGTGSDKFWIISAAASALDGAGTRSCTGIARQGQFSKIDVYWPNGQCNLDIEYKGGKGAPISGNYFREWLDYGARDGVRLANTHVTGERTIKMVLGLMEGYAKQYGPDSVKGWAFDHCLLVDPADLPQAAKLGAQFSCYSQINGSQDVARAMGDKIANTFSIPVKSMLKAGVVTAYESDSDRKAKWKDLQWFMERKDPRGKVWGPQERLDHQEVLRFFTRMGADYVLKGDKMGSLEVGKWADLAVLDRDFMATPPEQMGSVQPQMTMVGGKVVFAHPQFAQENNLNTSGVVVSTLAELKARRKPLGYSRR
jgi:predicted amidohydrolase YtcJ